MSMVRDQVISFLLQADDNNQRIISDLQKQITQLQKEIAEKDKQQATAEDSAVQAINGKASIV